MSKKLTIYNKKRNFTKTEEPIGKEEKPTKQLKFVVQHHMASRQHFDLRLEHNGVLLSWAVPKGPSYNPSDKRLAVMVEDHPLEYRHFEGTIPKGQYGGGTVMVWDQGTYTPTSSFNNGLKTGSLKFLLHGKRLLGKWALVRTNLKSGKEGANWLLMKEKDSFSKNEAGISHFVTSIKTARTMEEIEKGERVVSHKNPFKKVSAQLAKPVTALPKGQDWLFELKYDGYRILSFIEQENVKLVTRNEQDYTSKLPSIAKALTEFGGRRSMVLDGEVVATNKTGKINFQTLQNYFKNPNSGVVAYIVFDLLALDGKDLRQEPLLARKEKLKQLMKNAPQVIHFSEHREGAGEEQFKEVCKKGFEGLIGKRKDSVYSGTRNGDWIKYKCENRQEFVIGGYTQTEKKSVGISALLLGFYEGKSLIYAGRVGTGFTQKTGAELESMLKKIERKTPPFKQTPKASKNETVVWAKPELAAEIRFAEWTQDKVLRHPSFLGLRKDKNITEIKQERPDNAAQEEMQLTNAEKIIFKKLNITKQDVANYYKKVSVRMLPYVKNRILTIVRCPGGTESPCFYKKHPVEKGEGLRVVAVSNSQGKEDRYFYITESRGIMHEVQMNTLEFHVWGSEAKSLESPDIMVFDLDPDEGMDLSQIRQGVKDLKKVLEKLSLVSYLKTSGGKGYHVVVPFKPSASWEEFRNFAKSVAMLMEQTWPSRYTTNIRKVNRKGKIFIDWIRNTRGATSIAPYSIRARADARVSMPISWNQLSKVAPNGITMQEAIKHLAKKDPWESFFITKQKQSLKNKI